MPTWGVANAPPPASRRSLNRLVKKFRTKGTVQDLRKRRPSSREGVEEVCNDDMVDEVRAQLDIESARKADQAGCSSRRNPFNISPSSFFKIAKKKLGLHAFKLRKHQKLRRGNKVRRLAFCGQINRRYTLSLMQKTWLNKLSRQRNFFKNLIITDEAWLTLGGHVYNR